MTPQTMPDIDGLKPEASIASPPSQEHVSNDAAQLATNVQEQDWLTLRRRCELCKQRKVGCHRGYIFLEQTMTSSTQRVRVQCLSKEIEL